MQHYKFSRVISCINCATDSRGLILNRLILEMKTIHDGDRFEKGLFIKMYEHFFIFFFILKIPEYLFCLF